MILFELTQDESDPVYQTFEVSNGIRQYDFLKSIVDAAAAVGRPFLSQHLIKALNFQAIACLHTNAGDYRPCAVKVGDYHPPDHYRMSGLMDDFVNQVNRYWSEADAITLAAFVLWRLNYIHPFINGNGRTARAACYFVLCLKAGHWLAGQTILPELIRRDSDEYVAALKVADASILNGGELDLSALHILLMRLIAEQLRDVAH